MTDPVRQTLTALLQQHGLQAVPVTDDDGTMALEVQKTSAISQPAKLGKLRVVVVDTVEVLELVKDGKRETVPLCSPFVINRVGKLFGRPPPKWDPNR